MQNDLQQNFENSAKKVIQKHRHWDAKVDWSIDKRTWWHFCTSKCPKCWHNDNGLHRQGLFFTAFSVIIHLIIDLNSAYQTFSGVMFAKLSNPSFLIPQYPYLRITCFAEFSKRMTSQFATDINQKCLVPSKSVKRDNIQQRPYQDIKSTLQT